MPTRIAAIEKFEPDAESLIGLVRLFYGIGEANANFLTKWRSPFQATDMVFSNRGNEVELAVLAGAKLIQMMYSPSNAHSEMAALAVAFASCQGLRKNPRVPEILELTLKRLSEQTTERVRILAERANSELSEAVFDRNENGREVGGEYASKQTTTTLTKISHEKIHSNGGPARVSRF